MVYSKQDFKCYVSDNASVLVFTSENKEEGNDLLEITDLCEDRQLVCMLYPTLKQAFQIWWNFSGNLESDRYAVTASGGLIAFTTGVCIRGSYTQQAVKILKEGDQSGY